MSLREAATRALEALEANQANWTEKTAAIAALRTALQTPPPPPEAQTDGEKNAYAYGWWAAMEAVREQRTEPEQQLQWCECGDGYPPSEFDADGNCPNCVAGMTAGSSTEPVQEPLFLLHTGAVGSDGEQDEWETEADSGRRVDAFCRKHPGQTIGLYPHPAPDDTALLRQALEALDAYSWEQVDAARTALRERLGEKK